MAVIGEGLVNLFKQGRRIHIVFLAGLFLVTLIITIQSASYKQVAPKALLVYLLTIGCIYSGRWLTQQFLVKKRWALLISLFCLFVCLFSAAGIFAMAYLLGLRDGTDLTGLVVTVPLLVILVLFAGLLISITRIVIRQQIRESKILQYQSETELNLLTSKLSPHFLFNTLNNLYGLSRTDHDKVPGLLLKLSDLLDYALYSSDEPFVKLKEEVDYVLNFIELEKIRISDRLVLNIDIISFDITIKIAPMVLIVFVENAFKHAKNTLTGQVHISMRLWVESTWIHFEIENSIADQPALVEDKKTGLGITTTIKRLDLLYGKIYSLEHGRKGKSYFVNLKIPKNATH